ncbi:MAG TPA: peptidyl-tRNA hydrolase [Candidatus Thalassarchaeaceae archaeon]|nr:peptidyl-tRNA hydrolase [Candidatus Thalassarchaeaceae archaeon]
MSRTDEITMVIVTRKDLQLSKGKLAAQVGHAVMECVLKADRVTPKNLDRYRKEGARKIVVAARDLDEMKRLYGAISSVGIVCHLVRDAGHTEIPPGTITVMGVGPAPRESIDVFTSDLQLV